MKTIYSYYTYYTCAYILVAHISHYLSLLLLSAITAIAAIAELGCSAVRPRYRWCVLAPEIPHQLYGARHASCCRVCGLCMRNARLSAKGAKAAM